MSMLCFSLGLTLIFAFLDIFNSFYTCIIVLIYLLKDIGEMKKVLNNATYVYTYVNMNFIHIVVMFV